ncbi:hypothetical protein LR48_Vigan10g198300 [Vigna angularis]|uniref:Uncharacterized protein n=1 Tax=Phaseolus angularis TaxID=3914 RepID=A0A0L9VM06_PHAAN|nr:hypothetical protein LR48_Vigan10g198300 [Vigna angularis]
MAVCNGHESLPKANDRRSVTTTNIVAREDIRRGGVTRGVSLRDKVFHYRFRGY